eukprot:359940-Chlamydomonas_euryale.AAC.1
MARGTVIPAKKRPPSPRHIIHLITTSPSHTCSPSKTWSAKLTIIHGRSSSASHTSSHPHTPHLLAVRNVVRHADHRPRQVLVGAPLKVDDLPVAVACVPEQKFRRGATVAATAAASRAELPHVDELVLAARRKHAGRARVPLKADDAAGVDARKGVDTPRSRSCGGRADLAHVPDAQAAVVGARCEQRLSVRLPIDALHVVAAAVRIFHGRHWGGAGAGVPARRGRACVWGRACGASVCVGEGMRWGGAGAGVPARRGRACGGTRACVSLVVGGKRAEPLCVNACGRQVALQRCASP